MLDRGKKSAEDEKEDLIISTEDVINELGQFKSYQLMHYGLIVLPLLLIAIFNSNFVFVAREIDYRCKIPKCETNTTLNSLTTYWTESLLNEDYKCLQPVFSNNSDSCNANIYIDLDLVPCDEWIYENEDSLVANLNLACEPLKRRLIGTMHFAGMVISMPVMGFLSDKYGRKFTLLFCALSGGFIGLTKAFIKEYYLYITVEFLEALFSAAVTTTAFVLIVELTGKNKRFLMASLTGYGITSGEIIFGTIASQIQNYKTLIMVLYIPTVIVILYIFVLDESIRWLMIRGKMEKAKQIILKAARINKVTLSDGLLYKLDNIDKVHLRDVNIETAGKINFKEMVTSKTVMIRLLIALFWWFSSDLIYFGLMVNSVLLPGDMYQNFILTAFCGFFGDTLIMFTLNRIGRKGTMIIAYLICAVCILGSAFTPADKPWMQITLFLIGKVFITAAYSSVYTYASELFPTEVRSLLVGVSSMFAGIGSIIAPVTPLLADIMPQLPALLFGILALLSGFLAFFTPETLGKKLPDTIKEAERMG